MGACGAAYEIGPWLDAAKAQGLSAINTYIGSEQDPADYARMVSNDLMGITRDDLAYDLGRHVDDSLSRWYRRNRGPLAHSHTVGGHAHPDPGGLPRSLSVGAHLSDKDALNLHVFGREGGRLQGAVLRD
jgi:hypothetical protein